MSEKNKLSMEIYTIASYCGLMKSKHLLMIAFVLISFFNLYLGYAPSPVYILMVLVFLPYIITEVLHNKNVKEVNLTLSGYAKKHRYSKVNSYANNITYTFAILLTLLWFLNFKTIKHTQLWFGKMPMVILVLGIISRISITIYYFCKIKKSLAC